MLHHKNYFKNKGTSVNEQFLHSWITHQTIITLIKCSRNPWCHCLILRWTGWDGMMKRIISLILSRSFFYSVYCTSLLWFFHFLHSYFGFWMWHAIGAFMSKLQFNQIFGCIFLSMVLFLYLLNTLIVNGLVVVKIFLKCLKSQKILVKLVWVMTFFDLYLDLFLTNM